MKKIFRLIPSLVIILTSIFISAGVVPASAATNNSTSITSGGNAYRISPVRTDLVIQRGQSSSVTIYLTNISNHDVRLQPVVNDFQSNGDTGSPALLLNGQSLPKHGLKQYASVPAGTITAKPGQQQTVIATINIPSSAAPGGYYGAVRFVPVDVYGNQSVNLAASVGSLILVKVPGNVHENLTVTEFGAGRGEKTYSLFFNNKNLKAIVKFQNSGDVQEEPFGKIQLKKGNDNLALYEVNNTDPRGNVLPDSVRKFAVPLDKVGKFGKYTISGNFGYGSNGALLTASSTFYVIPVTYIVIAVILIILIVASFILIPKAVRRHDRRILRKANRR